jgi:F420H(2)-dependent quinone reductase
MHMPDSKVQKVRLPPRWFIRLFWITHRRLYRWTGGRLGLWRPKLGGGGTMAMNGWGDAEPAWWLNLQAHPDVTVDLVDGPCQVTARAAHGAERERLWDRWRQIDKNLDACAARRSMRTAVVVLEPRLQS